MASGTRQMRGTSACILFRLQPSSLATRLRRNIESPRDITCTSGLSVQGLDECEHEESQLELDSTAPSHSLVSSGPLDQLSCRSPRPRMWWRKEPGERSTVNVDQNLVSHLHLHLHFSDERQHQNMSARRCISSSLFSPTF